MIENFVKIRSIYSSLGNKKIVANCDEFINFSKSFRSFFKILNQKKEKFEQNKMYMGTLVEALDLMNLKARFNTIQEIVMNLTEQSLFMENETEQNLFMENADEYYSLILVNVNNNKMLIDEILNKIKLTDVLYKKVIGELNADIDLAIKEILTFKKDLLNKIYLDERIILVFDLYVSKLKEKQRCIKILSSENKTDCCPPSFDDDLIDGASLPPSFDDNLIDDLLNENKIKELNQRIIDNFVDKNTPERNLKTNPNIKRISDSSEFEDFLKEVKNLITDINNIENTFEKKTLAYRLFTYFNQSIHLSASLVEDESKREGIKGSSEEPVYLPTVEAAVFYQENKSKLFEIELIDYSFRTLVELIKSNSESLKKIILDADLIVDV